MKARPMKRTDRQTWERCEPREATYLEMNFPGPFAYRMLPVAMLDGSHVPDRPFWTWNGDTEKPTLKPSVKTWTDDEVCHSFVTDGRVQFLGDCTHEFAGKTVDLLDVEES